MVCFISFLHGFDELRPADDELRVAEKPQQDAGDEQCQDGAFVERHRAEIFVFLLNQLTDFFIHFGIVIPTMENVMVELAGILTGGRPKQCSNRLKPMKRNWSQIQAKQVLINIPGTLKAIHVAKFSPVSEPYNLQIAM